MYALMNFMEELVTGPASLVNLLAKPAQLQISLQYAKHVEIQSILKIIHV